MDEREFYEGTLSVELKLRGEGTVKYTAMVGNDDSTQWEFEVVFVNDDAEPDEGTGEEPVIENE